MSWLRQATYQFRFCGSESEDVWRLQALFVGEHTGIMRRCSRCLVRSESGLGICLRSFCVTGQVLRLLWVPIRAVLLDFLPPDREDFRG